MCTFLYGNHHTRGVRDTHDLIEEPPVIMQHEEHPDELALAKRHVLEVSDYTPTRCGYKYISDEDTSIWDPGSVDTSGVDTRDPSWHWDLGGVSNHLPGVKESG